MSAELQFVLYSVAAPLAAAAGVGWLLTLVLPAVVASRYTLAAALAAGMFVGYWLLPDWAPLVPARHWQWLAYLPLVAALSGGLSHAGGVSVGERWLVLAAVSGLAGWILVPMWATLWPPRVWAIPLLAGFLWLLMVLLSSLPDRLLGRLQLGLHAACCMSLAATIGVDVSARIGIVAAIAPAAMVGCWLTGWILPTAAMPTAVRGLVPAFAVLIGGMSFVGAIEVQPLRPLTFVPAIAPLLLWLFVAGPLSWLKGWTAGVAQATAVALPLIAALAWVAWHAANAESEW